MTTPLNYEQESANLNKVTIVWLSVSNLPRDISIQFLAFQRGNERDENA